MEDATISANGASADAIDRNPMNARGALEEGFASLKSLGNSDAVSQARAFFEKQSTEAPLRTAAIAVGVGLTVGLLFRGKPRRGLFRPR